MIMFTTNGMSPVDDEGENAIRDIQKLIDNELIEHDSKITIGDLYERYLGLPFNHWAGEKAFDAELFVNPYEWGWDKNGFRQLYRTRIIREEL